MLSTLASAVEPMGVGSIQHCMRLVVAAAGLPKGTCVHTLRHYLDCRTMLRVDAFNCAECTIGSA
jgi:hypothetical protein